MAVQLETYNNPYDPANPIQDAYAWLSFLAIDLRSDNGRIELTVNPNEAAWQATPLGTISVALGQVYTPADPSADPPVVEVRMPRLDELMSDPDFAQAYNTIGTKLYGAALAVVPALSGGKVV